MPYMKALALMICDKKIFKDFLLYLYVKPEKHNMASFLTRAMIWSSLVDGH